MKKTITIIAFLLTCLITCNATNNDQHLRLFVEKVNSASYSDALKELPLVSDWTNDNNLPLLDIDKFRSFLVYLSFFHTQKDSIWSSNHMNRLFVYIIPDFYQYINTCRENQSIQTAIDICDGYSTFTQKYLNDIHPFYIQSLELLSQLYIENNLPVKAIKTYIKIGIAYEKDFKYTKSEENFKIAYELTKKHCDKSSNAYIYSLFNIGCQYANAGKYLKAEKYLLECIQILEQYHPNDKIKISSCHTSLGNTYADMGRYDSAKEEMQKGIDALCDSTFSSSPELAKAYNSCGLYHKSKQQLEDALGYFLDAEKIYNQNNNDPEINSDYAQTAINIAQAYIGLRQYEDAQKYIDISARLFKQIHGANSGPYAIILITESDLYLDCGFIEEADSCAREAYRIANEYLPEDHPYIPQILQHLSLLYLNMGNTEKGKQYIREAVQAQRNICDSTLDFALLLMNCGQIYLNEYDFPKAAELYKEAIPIIEKNAIDNPRYAALTLQSLARLYTKGRNLSPQFVSDSLYNLAEKYLLRAQYILDSTSINAPDLYNGIYNDLGIHYFLNKDYNKALKNFYLSLEKQKEISTNNVDYGMELTYIGNTYIRMGKYDKAEKVLRESSGIIKDIFMDTWGFMSEAERTFFWECYQQSFTYSIPYLSLKYYPKKHSISDLAYDTELFTKGAILVSHENITKSITQSNDTGLINTWYELKGLKNQLYQMRNNNANIDSINLYEQKAISMEKELTHKCALYQENRQLIQTTWKEIRDRLKEDEVAIEFEISPINENLFDASYNALILRNNSRHPILIPLFTPQEVWKLLTKTGTDTYSYLTNEKEISQKIWKKILPYIKPKETVYFAPIGMLHQIAIENLPLDSTHSMGDIYNLVRLSSTREITSLRTPNTDTIAVLYGGIEYDIDSEEMSPIGTNRSSALYLEGTQQEIEEIHAILTAQDIPVTTYGDVNATEESFKALSGKHNSIIHIATHGFYWSDSTAKEETYFAQRASTIKKDKHTQIDPLSRCGLLFAGANNALEGNRNQIANSAQDGVLTAKEISTMDLHGTDIVVLSACETGLGEISADGVMGLQRAFKMAGVKTILMSLWQVDDDATKMLMSAFYRYWIGEKQAKRDAFRKAQNDVRAKYNSSEYWAGFILLD